MLAKAIGPHYFAVRTDFTLCKNVELKSGDVLCCDFGTHPHQNPTYTVVTAVHAQIDGARMFAAINNGDLCLYEGGLGSAASAVPDRALPLPM
jgi:hypothetical protein